MAPTAPTIAPTIGPPMSITYTFDDRSSMKDILNRVGISFTCIIRLMQNDGFESARDLVLTKDVGLKATVQNMNKDFFLPKDQVQEFISLQSNLLGSNHFVSTLGDI